MKTLHKNLPPCGALLALAALACCVLPGNLLAADPVPFKADVTGSGPPMILIPGLASGPNVWDGTVAHFKDHYQCHVLTLAGFAGQPPIEGPFLQKVRDGIIKYIHDQKLGHPVIIGHSLGGMMAFWVAETAPDDVGPIIAIDGLPFYSALIDPAATPDSARGQADQLRSMYAGLSAEKFAENNRRFLSMMITGSSNVDLVASQGDKSDPKAVGQAFFDLVTTDTRPGLKSIKSPVLLIGASVGEADEDAKKKAEEGYAAQISTIPRHKLVFAPSARHFIQLDDPAFFYRETDNFLKHAKE
ncbi:MAG TPA: alpha/beta hydrolase [Verrucomicrobiae bacterium]|jgi:pimeloyl-ACP methyl ester carboxylesterase